MKTLDKTCPYCGSTDMTAVTLKEERPDRSGRQCGACSKYAVLHQNGATYPLLDPDNKDSSPHP